MNTFSSDWLTRGHVNITWADCADNKIGLVIENSLFGQIIWGILEERICFGLEYNSKNFQRLQALGVVASPHCSPASLFLSVYPFPHHILPIRHFSSLDCEQAFSDNTMGPGNLYSCTQRSLTSRNGREGEGGSEKKSGKKIVLGSGPFLDPKGSDAWRKFYHEKSFKGKYSLHFY